MLCFTASIACCAVATFDSAAASFCSTSTALRFLIVAPLMVGLVAWRRPDALRIERGDALRYAVYGFVAIAFGETVMTAALGYTSVANMALLGPGTVSLYTAIWAAL